MSENFYKLSYKETLRENLSLAVYNTGYEKCRSGHTWGPGVRDHYLFHYVISGKGSLTSGATRYEIGRGDLFLIHPSRVVTYTADRSDPWEYCWVGFNGTEAGRLVGLTEFKENRPVLHYPNHDNLKRLLLNIYNSHGDAPSHETKMIGFLYLFLSELIHGMGTETIKRTSDRLYLEKAFRFIERNYCEMISVDDIAAAADISRSHLYRIFVKHLDTSPNEYLNAYRINKACGLLHSGTLKISEAANSVGFQDPFYFSRVFKKLKGLSPTAYLDTLEEKERTGFPEERQRTNHGK